MIRHSIVTAIFAALAASSSCYADSLVITYRSGKTQTVTLDEPSTTINSWQFMSGVSAATPLQQPESTVQVEQPKTAVHTKVEEKAKPATKSTDKPEVRVQWNAKPLSD